MSLTTLLRTALVTALLSSPVAAAAQAPAPLPPTPLTSVDQVIAMTKAGVPERVILALISRDRPIFVIDAVQSAQLRQKGISEPLLIAMVATVYQWPFAYLGYQQPCATSAAIAPSPFVPRGATSTRGIFFTNPTGGIFFGAPSSAPCR